MPILIRFLAGALSLALAGCAGFGGEKDAERTDAEMQRQPGDFDNVVLEPSQFRSGFVRDGMFVPVQELTQVLLGITQSDVSRLLGSPVGGSSDGWWFYNINLPLEGIDDYLVCQYRVTFRASRVTAVDWRRPQCSARYAELVSMISEPESEPQKISLSSDVLFAYDSASLSSAGERELDDVAYVILDEVNLNRVDVVGYADRIGGATYNQELSERRARVVGNYLQAKGIPSSALFVEGRGQQDPVVVCEGSQVTDELKRCLQPNRRVDITINGTR